MLKPALKPLQSIVRQTSLSLASLFKVEGYPFSEVITEGQLHIFALLIFRPVRMAEIICYTQYGKSMTIGCAALIISCIQGKKICVVAPSDEKAKIIMRYYAEHIGDSELFYSQLEKNTRLERLRQEESKERIMLRNGGGIFVLSAQQKNLGKSIEAAMGLGAEIVLIDEACLITDDTEATLFRMTTGQTIKGVKKDVFYCKIGNPFYALPPYTHFKTDWDNPAVYKIFIDANQGLIEGRITKEDLEIARRKPFYDILYDCEFPREDIIDKDGYQQLLISDQIKYAAAQAVVKHQIERERQIKLEIEALEKEITIEAEERVRELKKELKLIPRTKLGADIGGGGDYNAYVIRKGKYAFLAGKNRSKDTMVNVTQIVELMEEYSILPEDISVDDVGIGRGVVDRLLELDHAVNGVSSGDPAVDNETFLNLRAELYWEVKLWIQDGGQLDEREEWLQLLWIKYKKHTGEKRLQIEPKEKMKKRTRKSSDFSDALALTFFEGSYIGF